MLCSRRIYFRGYQRTAKIFTARKMATFTVYIFTTVGTLKLVDQELKPVGADGYKCLGGGDLNDEFFVWMTIVT